MSDYTPTTEQIKIAYVGKHPSMYTPQDRERAEEFDRWYRGLNSISDHDAYYLELLRQVWPEEKMKRLRNKIWKRNRLLYLALKGLTRG